MKKNLKKFRLDRESNFIGLIVAQKVKNVWVFFNECVFLYLCVESPPRPVSQEQILSHVTLDDGDSNSADRRGILIHYFLALCVPLVQEGLPCV